MTDTPKTEACVCSLCGRVVPARMITLHHLKPKQKGGKADDRVPMCRPCHKQIHATFDNGQLAHDYTDVESLRSSPLLQPFLNWIRKQKPDRNFRTAISDAHPRARRLRLRERRSPRSR